MDIVLDIIIGDIYIMGSINFVDFLIVNVL